MEVIAGSIIEVWSRKVFELGTLFVALFPANRLEFPAFFWSINAPVSRLRFVQCLWPIVLVLIWLRFRS